jgi:hypothetical protein
MLVYYLNVSYNKYIKHVAATSWPSLDGTTLQKLCIR